MSYILATLTPEQRRLVHQAGPLVKDLIFEPYAWPGGYTRFAICDDGEGLCRPCVISSLDVVHEGITGPADGWRIDALEHTGNTDDPGTCAHCYEEIT